MKLTATDRRSSRKVWPALSMALLFAGVCAAQPLFDSMTGPCSSSCESALRRVLQISAGFVVCRPVYVGHCAPGSGRQDRRHLG